MLPRKKAGGPKTPHDGAVLQAIDVDSWETAGRYKINSGLLA